MYNMSTFVQHDIPIVTIFDLNQITENTVSC